MKNPRLYIYEVAPLSDRKATLMITYLIQYPDGTCEYFYDIDQTWNISAWTGTTARLDKDEHFKFVGYL